MQEYVTDAVVLKKEPLRDFDARYAFFTKRFGKIVGKATSSRKITSKLAGHLEPGTLATVRFVERHGGGGNGSAGGGASVIPQIADSLKRGTIVATVTNLHFLSALLLEWEPDQALWEELAAEKFSWPNVLRILGWDPTGATCSGCGKRGAMAAFSVKKQEFFCATCASKVNRNELVLLDNAEV